MKFVLAIQTDAGKAYGVTVPDLAGCFSSGDSLEEALENAAEAIDAHVELLAESGQELVPVKSLTEHKSNPDYQGADWVIIDVPVEKYYGPSEKINITVPPIALRRIDRFTKQINENRSAFFVKAAERYMKEKGFSG